MGTKYYLKIVAFVGCILYLGLFIQKTGEILIPILKEYTFPIIGAVIALVTAFTLGSSINEDYKASKK